MVASSTTSFVTPLALPAATERLDLILAGLQREADAHRVDGGELRCRIHRRGPHHASVWTSEDHLEVTYSVELSAVPDGTKVDLDIDDIRWRGRRLPRRLTRRLFGDPASLAAEWFDPAFDPATEPEPDPSTARSRSEELDEHAAAAVHRSDDIDWDHPRDPAGQALRGELLAAIEAPRALDAPGVTRAVLRRRMLAAAQFGLATISIVVMLVFGARGAEREELLRTSGIDATGTVVEVPHGDDDDLVIDYDTASGEERYVYFDPDGEYEVGQELPIRYLPDSNLVAVGDEWLYDAETSDPSVLGGFGAIIFLPAAVRTASRTRATRRALQAGPFRLASIDDYCLTVSGRVLYLVLVDGDDVEPTRLVHPFATPPFSVPARWGAAVRFGKVLVAGEGRRRVVLARPGCPSRAATSRVSLRRAWWMWRIRNHR